MNKRLAILLASVAALQCGSVIAESRVTAVTAAATSLSTTARLNVAVNVPRILYLRVGDAGAAINTVTFTAGLTGVTVPTTDSVYAGAMPVGPGAVSAADDNGASDGQVAVQLWTNNGSANLNCTGAALTSGANTIPLSDITVTSLSSGGSLAHPGASLACASGARGSAGTNNLTDTWTFAYAPTVLPPAGAYTTVVTYTASQP